MDTIETRRLVIRGFVMEDLERIHQILDFQLADINTGTQVTLTLEERKNWLTWTILGYSVQQMLSQPPFGYRAVMVKGTGGMIGTAGFIPYLDFFEPFPSLKAANRPFGLATSEIGLFCAIAPVFQRQGYGSEAVKGLIEFGFSTLALKRIVACSTLDNSAAIRVMEKCGMQIERNPLPGPVGLQVVGFLNHA